MLLPKSTISKILSIGLELNYQLYEWLIGFPIEETGWYYNYASMYGKQGRRDLALGYLEKAITVDPSYAEFARQDNDLRRVWDDQFTRLVDSAKDTTFTLSEIQWRRIVIFDIVSVFVLLTVLLFALGITVAGVVFEYGLLFGIIFETLQIMVFGNRLFFKVISTPLIYGTVLFTFISSVIHNQGMFIVQTFTYIIFCLYLPLSIFYQWRVFGPSNKEYFIYRIQNISQGTLEITTLIFAIIRGGYWIQSIFSQDCLECGIYYFIQLFFFSSIYILSRIMFRNGIKLSNANTFSVITTFAYIVLILITINYTDVFYMEFIILFVVIYTTIVLLTIIIAITENHFTYSLEAQIGITRRLIKVFFVWIAISNIYGFVLNSGLLHVRLPAISNPPLSLIIAVNSLGTAMLWLFYFRLKGVNVMGNYISISGVNSSSINVASPFATALVSMDHAGKQEAALALMQIKDLVEATEFDGQQKQHARELLEAIAEEGKKPEPRKFTLSTLTSELSTILSGVSTIADKIPALVEQVSKLWQ